MTTESQTKIVSGVYAAVLVPRDDNGRVDEPAYRALVRFLFERGIRGFAVNGATGEYCLTTPSELARLIAITREESHGAARLLAGVGAASLYETVARCDAAASERADALLVPMPNLFFYGQADLAEFQRQVAARTKLPVLLYNLPFNSRLEQATVHGLMRDCANIVGIKDSTGSLDILRSLDTKAWRIVGSDGVLAQARREAICDGVVSGVACAVPELIQALFAHEPNEPEFARADALLTEFIAHIESLPVPWGLKAVAEARGVFKAHYEQPVAAERCKEIAELQRWVNPWLETALESIGATVPARR